MGWRVAGVRRRTVGTVTKSRMEAFSDGVLAIAITLLVIEIRPVTRRTLRRVPFGQCPNGDPAPPVEPRQTQPS
jgi:hypothetical protein